VADIAHLRHTAAHVLAYAVQDLFPDAKPTIGPAIENGFYYDFDRSLPFTPEDLEKLEARMHEIVRADYPMTGRRVTRDEAVAAFRGNPYKVELAEQIPDGEPITLYTIGEFTDLCRGGHADSTGAIGALKLNSVAGAYWRGDEHNAMLQRIYGTAFETPQELDDYLAFLEEAAKRDHRKLGAELDLYHVDELAGGGLIFWHPKGAIMRGIVEQFIRDGARECLRDLRTSRELCREHVRPDRSGGSAFPAQADELSGPHPHLQERRTLVPRSPAALQRVRYRLPVRAQRHAARTGAGARFHAG
jgi:threonyl-tRNA synthetase